MERMSRSYLRPLQTGPPQIAPYVHDSLLVCDDPYAGPTEKLDEDLLPKKINKPKIFKLADLESEIYAEEQEKVES